MAADAAGNFVITWTSAFQDTSGYGVYAQRFNAAGAAQGSEFRVNTYTANDQDQSAVAVDGAGNFIVAWESNGQDGSGYGVYAQRYFVSQAPVGGEFRVNSYTTGDQTISSGKSVAADAAGNFIVTWTSQGQDGSGAGVYAQRYNAAGVAQGGEFRVNTTTASDQSSPAVGADSAGNFVVSWQSLGQDGNGWGIYAQRYSAAGVPQGAEFRVNSYTVGNQSEPAVAVDAAGNFVIAWTSDGQDGSGYGVYAQRYNAAGVPQGGEFRVNSFVAGNQQWPRVAADAAGNFVVAWMSEGVDGSNYGISAQRYNAAGVPQGGQFRANTYTTDSQANPAVAVDAAGNFVIAWASNGQDGSGGGIYAQRYNAAGVPQGGEFRVNSYTAGDQFFPAVSADSAGNFVIAWVSQDQDGSGYGVYAQRYSAAGAPQGGEFRVNSYTASDQSLPAVAVDAAGNFVVSWQSWGQDGSGWGIYAQRYNAAGVPQGIEFRVNTTTAGNQWYPAVAAVRGSFVVAWNTDGQDGSGSGVYAQRYLVQTPAPTFRLTPATNPVTAGTPVTFTVTALDPYGNVATGYRGTVHFASTDGLAGLPDDFTFTAGDSGVRSFPVTLRTAGNRTITATDTATGVITGSVTVAVNPGVTSFFVVAGFPSPVTAGVAGMVTVTAQDAFRNPTPAYRGTVHFTSSDTRADLPANYTFMAADNGVHTFAVTLKTAGRQDITATDTSINAVGSQNGIIVNPAAVASLVVAGFPSPITAGVAGMVTVTAVDAFGNTTPAYRGTVGFASSDPRADLPGPYAFLASDNGVHTFTATLKTAGSRAITATDTATSGIRGTQNGITVNPAATSVLLVGGFPSPVTAGTSGALTVTAQDAFGNVTPAYRGTVHIGSSDPQAVLPADYPFTAGDNGVHTFSGTVLKTAATQSLTAADGRLTGTQSGIVVTPAATSTLVVSGFPAPVTAGTSGALTVTAQDAFGNVTPAYRGTVRVGSSDPQAMLPADYTFTAGDNGVHMFGGIILKTAGTQSLSATDTGAGTISGRQDNIRVDPAAASRLDLTGLPATVLQGVAAPFTVTAKDPFGNVAPGYRGTVQFSSTDGLAVLPAPYTFQPEDNGSHTFPVTFLSTGSRGLTARDPAAGFSATATTTVRPLYNAATPYPVGRTPFSITTADFNGDGLPDLATPNRTDGTVSVLLGVGDGSFLPALDSFAGFDPVFLAAGDFNGDGLPDLAAADAATGAVNVLLGNGDGTFQDPVAYAAGARPIELAVGDFNGDGIPDLVTANSAGGSVSVLLGVGDGSFLPAIESAAGPQPLSVRVGDFNGDGIPDVVTANFDDSTVSVLLGNGDGSFQPALVYGVGREPYQVVVADFNGDGLPDVATANYGGNSVSVLLGQGDGTLADAVSYPAGPRASAIAAGDFDGDGIPDVAVANGSAGTVSLLLGTGTGALRAPLAYAVGSSPVGVVVADLNGDGLADLAVANAGEDSVSVLLRAVPDTGAPSRPGHFGGVGEDTRPQPQPRPEPDPSMAAGRDEVTMDYGSVLSSRPPAGDWPATQGLRAHRLRAVVDEAFLQMIGEVDQTFEG